MSNAPINADRVESADVALQAFHKYSKWPTPFWQLCPQDQQDILCDLLANLRHWCRAEAVDFEAAVRISQDHFEEECDAEEEPVTTTDPYSKPGFTPGGED